MDFPDDSAIKNLPAVQETWVRSQLGKIPWRREWLPTPVFWPGEFHGLVLKSQTRLSKFHQKWSMSKKSFKKFVNIQNTDDSEEALKTL